jgi:hypothetical protein
MARRMATGSASGRTVAVAGVEVEAAEAAVDPFSMAAVLTRKEIWGVRNISRLSPPPLWPMSN